MGPPCRKKQRASRLTRRTYSLNLLLHDSDTDQSTAQLREKLRASRERLERERKSKAPQSILTLNDIRQVFPSARIISNDDESDQNLSPARKRYLRKQCWLSQQNAALLRNQSESFELWLRNFESRIARNKQQNVESKNEVVA
jgi:hypothetical protein